METIKLEFLLQDAGHWNGALVRLNGQYYELIRVQNDLSGVKPSISFGGYVNNLIRNLKSSLRERTAETYRSALNSFIKFYNHDIKINDITSEIVKDYERYLVNRGIALNTISFYMRIMRSVYNKAVQAGFTLDCQPFAHVYTGVVSTHKRAITIEDIRAIKELKLDHENLRFARDLFLFSFYTHGMPFVDIAYLKKAALKNGFLSYTRHKTGQKVLVKWEPCMQHIVDQHPSAHTEYMLPIIKCSNGKERNQYRGKQSDVNRCLKIIGQKVGLTTNLTMYVARHSWASIAASMNTPIEIISKGMGHTSIKTTKIYLQSLDWAKIDKVNSLIIDKL